MKTCHSCGAEIHDQAVLCVHCDSSQEVLPTVGTVSNVNVCPNCGNECHKDAIICVKCGQSLVQKQNNTQPPKKQNKGVAKKVVTGFAIFFALGQLVLSLLQLEDMIYYLFDGYFIVVVPYVITLLSHILIFIGFIIGKKNKLPGVGFLLSAMSLVIYLVNCVVNFDFIIEDSLLALGYIVYIVMNVMIVAMYFSKKDSVRKLWFVSALFVILRCIISIFYEYFDSYYFGIDDVMFSVATYVYALVSMLVFCLNAKMNWSSSD